jgi:succinate-semialdehyde dehydrogenase/glutarate-semialdehyde dehydrogenase
VSITAINPASGQVIRRYPETDERTAQELVAGAHEAFLAWRETDFAERRSLMSQAARILVDRSREWGELMAREMGKPVGDGVAEAEKCAWVCRYYAEHAESFLAPHHAETEAHRSYWTHRPLGVVLAVMPWNFPFWQVFRFAAPGLMAGNAAVLKHAANVPGCALAIEEIFSRAGFPDRLFRTLLIDHATTEALLENPLVRAATVTGSVAAGRAIAAKAGSRVKKTVLELGGSDPYVILADADLDRAAGTCATSRLINSGQSCIAAKRFIVVDEVHDAWLERFVERMRSAKMGEPLDDDTQVGPQAREDLRDDLHDQVRRSVEGGATCLLGGEIPDRPGWWYPPTVLADVQPDTPAWEEELFGPVAAVIRAEDEDDAIRIANDSSFGLGAAVFTADVERGERIAADRLDAGCCFVNSFVKSDPRLPFGGVKESGHGRELSPLGIREFVNVKTVWVER